MKLNELCKYIQFDENFVIKNKNFEDKKVRPKLILDFLKI